MHLRVQESISNLRDAYTELLHEWRTGSLTREQERVQQLTDKYVEEIDRLITKKEAEVMEV